MLLAGFEPEEESPIVFLRLRRAVRTRGLPVFDLAPFATRAAEKLSATVLTTLPGAEAQSLRALADGSWGGPAIEALRQPGAVVLAGERLAEVPGAFSALRGAGAGRPAPAWPGCRAGPASAVRSRPARCPACCPAAGRVADAAARADVAQRWGIDLADVPAAPGRDTTGILTAARDGALGGLLVGGVDPADLPDPALAEAALAAAGFVVSLELFPTAVTEYADVVLPVATASEKAGSYLDWEGRARTFDATLHGTGALPDGRVLQGLADEMDADLRLPTPEAARAELAALGTARRPGEGVGLDVRPPAAPSLLGQTRPSSPPGGSCSTLGTLQRDERELAGTARPAVARIGAGTAPGSASPTATG